MELSPLTCLEGGASPALCWRLLALPESLAFPGNPSWHSAPLAHLRCGAFSCGSSMRCNRCRGPALSWRVCRAPNPSQASPSDRCDTQNLAPLSAGGAFVWAVRQPSVSRPVEFGGLVGQPPRSRPQPLMDVLAGKPTPPPP